MTYRVGIIGTGTVARLHATAVRACDRTTLVAGADRSAERLESWAQRFRVPRTYLDYETMLEREQLDIVAVTTWPAAHREPVLAATRARGRTRLILCEKPLALSAAEAEEMYAAARTAGIPLVEGFMYRFLPHVSLARRLVNEGAVGALRIIRAGFTSGLSDPAKQALRPDTGGGSLMDHGCYCVNAARFLAGIEPASAAATAVFDQGTGVDVALFGMLRFPNGTFALFDTAFGSAPSMFVELVGERAVLRLPDPFVPPGSATVVLTAGSLGPVGALSPGRPQQTQMFRFPAVHLPTAEYRALCAYLDAGEPLPVAEDEGIHDMRVIDALYCSARAGGAWVSVASSS